MTQAPSQSINTKSDEAAPVWRQIAAIQANKSSYRVPTTLHHVTDIQRSKTDHVEEVLKTTGSCANIILAGGVWLTSADVVLPQAIWLGVGKRQALTPRQYWELKPNRPRHCCNA